jgi:hypothetical protein
MCHEEFRGYHLLIGTVLLLEEEQEEGAAAYRHGSFWRCCERMQT